LNTAGWIRDLNQAAPKDPIETDVCILGAGPVGLTLACALAKRGHRVAILEIGGATPRVAAESSALHFDRRVYRGATVGRALGLGGTSALWGGQLLPVRAADLLARTQIAAPAWPIPYSQLEPYFGALQDLLGLASSGFGLDSLRAHPHALSAMNFTDWQPRLSKWLAFGRRNFTKTLSANLRGSARIALWLNAETGRFALAKDGGKWRIRELVAASPSGGELRVQPKSLVIAGGALESARLVLELDELAGSLSPGVSEFAGRFLHDHLSLRIARVTVLDRAEFERRFAPFFEGATMRSLRMELPPEILHDHGLPALYAHFIAEAPPGSGFAVIRDLLRAAQSGDARLALDASRRLPGSLPEIARILYHRAATHRLAFADRSDFFLHVDLEQAPLPANRVYLGTSRDGARRDLHIDWDVDPGAPRIARCVQGFFERFWERNALGGIARLDFLDLADDARAWNHNVYDLYHPAGTTRMSADPSTGVVDTDLRIHGAANAYVVGSSVFPSLGAANPTFTAMALALRLADRLGGA
jgi:choline dehydrogenase-like flavoprotein